MSEKFRFSFIHNMYHNMLIIIIIPAIIIIIISIILIVAFLLAVLYFWTQYSYIHGYDYLLPNCINEMGIALITG